MIRSATHRIPRVGVAAILFFALLTALTARITIPLPFTVVPITLQTLAVLLSGLVLGSRQGALSQVAYLAAMAAGLPLSASGMGGVAAFMTPTAGYLVAFVPAAFVAGYFVEQLDARTRPAFAVNLLAGIAGMLVIYMGGVAWLAWFIGDFATALQQGLLPFMGVDLGKAVVAALVASGGRRIFMPTA
jgi:biotin transport system substrate-specific component